MELITTKDAHEVLFYLVNHINPSKTFSNENGEVFAQYKNTENFRRLNTYWNDKQLTNLSITSSHNINRNIKVGQVFKNYKELCNALNENVKSGKSKQLQLKKWERYFSLSKDGNKFIINEIFAEPKEKINNRKGRSGTSTGSRGNNNVYGEKIELLVLDLLVQNKNKGHVIISKNQLLKAINMINGNYSPCSENIQRLSTYLEMPKAVIFDFYTSSRGSFKSTLEAALNSLRNKSLIFWSKVISICITNELGEKEYRIATQEEKGKILKYEKETLISMGFGRIADIMFTNRWREFKEKIEDVLKEKTCIDYYYVTYEITVNKEHIHQEYEKLLDLVLSSKDRKEYRNYLNTIASERLQSNATKRRIVSNEAFGINAKYIDNVRASEDYLVNHQKLIDLLIKQNADYISLYC